MTDTTAALRFLELTLAEAQATVRSYDTKAQIVGIGYTFALNIVANASAGFPRASDGGMMALVVFWSIVMAPLFLFGAVLYPSRRLAPKIHKGDTEPRRLMYVETARFEDLSALCDATGDPDWHNEICYEILKVSRLRELKRARFIRALAASMLSFAVLCALELAHLV
ncbi:hypothetical protein Z945_2562 [Sulfitobacter noctilucae]|uniref:hypothetical protein n=1 Tax=Sulfitobacter noctilucae TaxID=1342302 RepID=UPI0004692858|nr:hypothetical protein [Sulfitobacter noctilucae]KIN61570.1 hypothetical protein Z945_2562 [Sulfitobacter noctilucae]